MNNILTSNSMALELTNYLFKYLDSKEFNINLFIENINNEINTLLNHLDNDNQNIYIKNVFNTYCLLSYVGEYKSLENNEKVLLNFFEPQKEQLENDLIEKCLDEYFFKNNDNTCIKISENNKNILLIPLGYL